jgi:hypothetical protein
VTYRAADADTGAEVAVKALSLRSLRDWKQLELFQREAQTLASLEHPGIPRYIDAFEEDADADRTFFLVQALAEGRTLEDLVQSGWRADEDEVRRIGAELLGVLQYLGERRPPVAHRDVKPANVVLGGGRAGGRVFLVDFGGVQAVAAAGDLPGSTVVGTYGFMAPEQFRGAAQPASDLYGLGGTLLYLITGRPPSAFPVDRMRLDVSSVRMGTQLEAVVSGLLEPVLEDRMGVEEALAVLQDRRRPARSGGAVGGSAFRRAARQAEAPPAFLDPGRPAVRGAGARRKPPGSRIEVTKRGPRLEIDIPPARFDGARAASGVDALAGVLAAAAARPTPHFGALQPTAAPLSLLPGAGSAATTGAFAIAWNAFVAFWTISALAGGGILFALFSIPFWTAGASLLKQAFGRQLIRERLEIGLGRWALRTQLAALRSGAADWGAGGKEAGGRTADLAGAQMQVVGFVNGQPQGRLVLKQGVETVAFGEGLDPLEQEWLADVINSHLEDVASTRGELDGAVEAGGEDEDEDEDDYGGGAAADEEFRDFDARLGGGAEAAAQRGREAAEAGRRAGQEAAAAAEREARRAVEAASRQAERAQRAAKRAAGGPPRADPFGTIELGSGDFDVQEE